MMYRPSFRSSAAGSADEHINTKAAITPARPRRRSMVVVVVVVLYNYHPHYDPELWTFHSSLTSFSPSPLPSPSSLHPSHHRNTLPISMTNRQKQTRKI
ncbi:hypothetical protein E2C01_016316 [Portunus trituberculatus]|uniref:Uncharacterized protein n=1 Tax=Portunus trituberculatus TaxID=210409 RepID=A0A5B7DQR2_PORTR|nr:hypothetical protein [Portunus trituberculatus]